MTSKREIRRRYSCPTCHKVGERVLPTDGSITALVNQRCNYTSGCRGIPIRDDNAVLTTSAHQLIAPSVRVVRSVFTRTNTITVTHNFGSSATKGTILVDVFVEAFDSNRERVLVKQLDYQLISCTSTTAVIDIGLARTGEIVLTNMQPDIEVVSSIASVSKSDVGQTLLNNNNMLTVALPINTNTVAGIGLGFPITVKQYGKSEGVVGSSVDLLLYNHISDPRGRVGGNAYNTIRTTCIHGEIYVLYSGLVSTDYVRRGALVEFTSTDSEIERGFVLLARGEKVYHSDIVTNFAVRVGDVKFGTIYGDGVQWVIGTTSSVDDAALMTAIDPPMMLV